MKYLSKFLRGIVVGIANIIPGLCSGSVALILNVYDDLLYSLSFDWEYIKKNWFSLCILALGILFGIFGFSYIISLMLKNYYNTSIFVFVGLVAGGIPFLFKRAKTYKDKTKSWLKYLVLALTFAIIVGLSFVKLGDNTVIYSTLTAKVFLLLFAAGLVGAFGMILPGLSGSFLLLLMGCYATIIEAVKTFKFLILIPFAMGGILGLFLGAKFVKKMFAIYPKITYFAIIGMVIGSIFALYPGFSHGINILWDILAIIVGAGISVLLGFISKD